MKKTDHKFHTTTEAAAELGVTRERIYALIRSRRVGTKAGRDWLLTRAEIETLRDRRPGRPKKE